MHNPGPSMHFGTMQAHLDGPACICRYHCCSLLTQVHRWKKCRSSCGGCGTCIIKLVHTSACRYGIMPYCDSHCYQVCPLAHVHKHMSASIHDHKHMSASIHPPTHIHKHMSTSTGPQAYVRKHMSAKHWHTALISIAESCRMSRQ